MSDRPLPPVCRLHLEVMTGPLGIWQHASGSVPDESHGYCTDDVARALVVDLLHWRCLGWDVVREDARRSLAFLRAAHDPAGGAFRNFRAADGTWLESAGSQDSQGRALLALGIAVADSPDRAFGSDATQLFDASLPLVTTLTALRATSSAILACDAALGSGVIGTDGEATLQALESLAARLRAAFEQVDHGDAWPWPEPILTYENAVLPRALIAAGRRLGDSGLQQKGLGVLDWLIRAQTAPDGSFSPIGNDGWWPRGGPRSRFDQQPIEATATILAVDLAFEVTGDERYRRAAESAYGWFLGDNDAGLPVADPRTGGCHDGLSARQVNASMGAESTLMWQIAVESMRRLRSRRAPLVAARTPGMALQITEVPA